MPKSRMTSQIMSQPQDFTGIDAAAGVSQQALQETYGVWLRPPMQFHQNASINAFDKTGTRHRHFLQVTA